MGAGVVGTNGVDVAAGLVWMQKVRLVYRHTPKDKSELQGERKNL